MRRAALTTGCFAPSWDIITEPCRRADSDVGEHSAVMPMTPARLCVMIASAPRGVAFDLYAGSGTTLPVARELNRRWRTRLWMVYC